MDPASFGLVVNGFTALLSAAKVGYDVYSHKQLIAGLKNSSQNFNLDTLEDPLRRNDRAFYKETKEAYIVLSQMEPYANKLLNKQNRFNSFKTLVIIALLYVLIQVVIFFFENFSLINDYGQLLFAAIAAAFAMWQSYDSHERKKQSERDIESVWHRALDFASIATKEIDKTYRRHSLTQKEKAFLESYTIVLSITEEVALKYWSDRLNSMSDLLEMGLVKRS